VSLRAYPPTTLACRGRTCAFVCTAQPKENNSRHEYHQRRHADHYKDWGSGQLWYSAMAAVSAVRLRSDFFFLASRGYRCIAHERAGKGRASKTLGPAQRFLWDYLRRRSRRIDRKARLEECRCRSVIHRWRRGCTLPWATRYKARGQAVLSATYRR